MTIYQAIVQTAVALMLLSRPGLANDNADAVNERIPVAGAELEAHWQVDCSATLDSLRGQLQATGPDCSIAVDTRRAIRLCAYIYQPPGGRARHKCPNYQQLLNLLPAAGQPQSCAELQATFLPRLACGSLPP